MSATTAFQCDGPACEQLTTKPPGTQWPPQWVRLTVFLPGAARGISGAFHDRGCAEAWIAEHVELHPETDAFGIVRPETLAEGRAYAETAKR